MKFYLGTSMPSWMRKEEFRNIPLFVSDRRLKTYKNPVKSIVEWACDSGGFTELSMYGEWRTPPHRYAARVRKYMDTIPGFQWASIQDWMCEPWILEKTRKTVQEHQELSLRSLQKLRVLTQDVLWIPVLQGWERDDYLRHWEMYEKAGFDLHNEPVVGLGSVCRRESTIEAEKIVRSLQPLRLHGFGMKTTAVSRFGHLLNSSDSLAWSFAGRMRPDPDCDKKSCSNCVHYALEWYENLVSKQSHDNSLYYEQGELL